MSNRDRLLTPTWVLASLFLALTSLLIAPSASANVLPEAAMLVHVRTPMPEGWGCTTDITDCNQIVHTTSAEGQLEFLIFFYPIAYEQEHLPIHHLTTELVWPDTWEFVRWTACSGAAGSLNTDGPDHTLSLNWPNCPVIEGSIIKVASLVLNVTGPGRLAFGPPYTWIPVWLGCPPEGFTASALGSYAAAGLECGYSLDTCARTEYCRATFDPEELVLTAPVGGTDEEQAPFTAASGAGPHAPCPLVVTPHAPWVQATVVAGDWPNYHLAVVADAAGLAEGLHETWIEVSAYSESRCLKVNFAVTTTTGLPEDPGSVERQTWGRIKDSFRRP